ncbi:putative trans-2-enoyl-CoA reductase 1 mitochondrial [Spathaspora sp. JA1]|nr:putative trans-2-enoyl-CoA reductase 1 mitochondrial [Spathaspora sp. JA1]
MIQAKAATYTSHGKNLDQILTDTSFTINTPIQPNQILLRTLATPINPSDVHQIYGGYNVPRTITDLGSVSNDPLHVGGNEGVFEVVEVGTSVTGYQQGDTVIPQLPGFGTWRSYALVNVELQPLIKMNGLTLEQASTISINPCTAYQILNQFIKDWQDGDWVIQNAGNSQVSKYFTQLTRLRGIKVVSVIRNDKSEADIEELYELGATKVIKESEFLSESFDIEKLTNGGNVRLALNSVGGTTVAQLVKSLSIDGTLVTYGVVGSPDIVYDGRIQLFKNITTTAYWLTSNTKRNPNSKIETINKLIELYQQKKIKDVDFGKVIYSKNEDLKKVILEAISKDGKQVVIYQ